MNSSRLPVSATQSSLKNFATSLASADRRVRWAAAYALGQIGAGAFAMDSADALCEAMADDDGDIRWAATNLMVQLGRENLLGD